MIERAGRTAAPFQGLGPSGDEIAGIDWHQHRLGPPAQWPTQLTEMLATILASPQPMFLAWGEALTFFHNDAYGPLLGKRAGRAIGRAFPEVWADEWPALAPLVSRAMAGEGVKFEEWPLRVTRNFSPEDTWWSFSYMPLRDRHGGVAGMWCITNEATKQVLAGRAAAAERARQQRSLQQMPGFAALLVGPTHVFEYVNDAYRTISGDRDFIGRPVRTVFPELAGQGYYELLDEVYASGRRHLAEGMALHLRGEAAPRFIDLLCEPILDDAHKVSGIFVGGYDVTRAYRSLAALAESEERLRLAAQAARELNETLEQRVEERTRALRDQMDFARLALTAVGGVGVWTYEVATDKFFCDASIAKLYDIDPEEAQAGIARPRFLANVHDDDRPYLRRTMEGGLVHSGDLGLEYRLVHADGSVHWVLSRGHTYFENGQPVRRTGVGIDMTRQREIEEQLRQSQKMEAVGQLTGGLAHDFNNLLTGVIGSLERVESRIAQGRHEEVGRYLIAAQAAANRAASLTHRLLAFSRRQTLDPKAVDVNALVAGMDDLVRRTIGPEIALAIIPDAALWPTFVDAGQLENALLNLCINARDALPDGGRITIETGNRRLEARTGQSVPPGDYVVLSVADTGTGMPPEVIAKAFDPFFTTKPLGQGTGLGLSMIYGFAQQSGGQVRIASEVGQGTTVSIVLPRHAAPAAPAEIAPAPSDSARAAFGETVLVVDDEPTVRMLITEVLEELGYTAIEADDGASALHLLQQKGKLDLLVTDVGLPGGMNGRQLADAARVGRPGLKVLFITGYAENAVVGQGHLEPGMHVLTKPFALEALAVRIKQIVAGD